jgi:type IV pilus assembly protein PilO
MDPRLEKLFKLPTKQKVAVVAAIVALEGAGIFFGLQKPKMDELKQKQATLEGLRSQIVETKKIADNLPRFRSEYAKLQQELEKALTELPNQKEIPTLLTSITSAGKGSGLDFLIFRPKPEEPKEFYAVVPVDISVSGSFISVSNFFNAVAALPRIVNISNVNFDVRNDKGSISTKVNCLATTFRFLDKKEIKDDSKKPK